VCDRRDVIADVEQADKDAASPDDMQKTTVEYLNSRHSSDVLDEVTGPLSNAKSDEPDHPDVLVRKTVHEEKTEVWKDDKRTGSEDAVSPWFTLSSSRHSNTSRSRRTAESFRPNELAFLKQPESMYMY
jgi:hypothetical protein